MMGFSVSRLHNLNLVASKQPGLWGPLLQFQGNGDDDSAIGDNVPQHRIQQIRYKNDKIIWEKQTRTDFVFGSTGYSGTITDFIRSLEEEERRAEDVAVTIEEEAFVQA